MAVNVLRFRLKPVNDDDISVCSCEILLGHNENINLGVLPLLNRKNFNTDTAMKLTNLLTQSSVPLVSRRFESFSLNVKMKVL